MASADLPSRFSSSSSSKYIPLHKTQLHPRMHTFTLSSHTNPTKSSASHHHKPLLLIIFLSFCPFVFYLYSLYRSLHLPSTATFGLVIEIARSHSEIRVFRSLNEVSGTPFSGESSESMRARPGLSGSDPETLGEAVLKLVEFAKEKVPSSEWPDTKVQLMVTAAGYDELVGREVKRVLEECRRVLRSSGLLFKDDWASIMGGQDEGLYNWLAVNYAFGYMGKIPQETAGVIVLGRSAMQVSYASNESPQSKFSRVIRFAGVSYNLYAQSLQQFGQDAIWKLLHEKDSQYLTSSAQEKERLVSNSCIPRGFELPRHASDQKLVKSRAAGNFSTCKSELMTLLNGGQGKCAHPPCELTPSILNKLERKPHPRQRFFLSSQVQGLVPKASASGLEAVGHHFCEDDWENLKRQYDIDDIDLSRTCFSHAFMAILLQDDFGIPFTDKRVEFAAGSTPIDWKLGAFLSRTIMDPVENVQDQDQDQETRVVGNESISYLLLFAVVLIFVLLAAFFVMKFQKPRFKTIYDLEKGRYIVTRVPR